VLILPEDDANPELANGFLLGGGLHARAVQILPAAGGWTKVRDQLASTHVPNLRRYQQRHLVLLVDFDGDEQRRAVVLAAARLGGAARGGARRRPRARARDHGALSGSTSRARNAGSVRVWSPRK
jgi:hypothetical protein